MWDNRHVCDRSNTECVHTSCTEKGCADGKRKLGGEVTHDRVRSWNIA